MAQLIESTLAQRERELITETIPLLLRAQSQGLPLGAFEILQLLFPGRQFAQATEALTFRASNSPPLDPSNGPWRSVTEAPEMLAGAPLY
jgi:hypothetical protein